MYVPSSAYAPCILHALRFFDRDQFLFLRYEDLVRMSAPQVVRLLGDFLGAHVDGAVLKAADSGPCAPASSRGTRSFVARSPFAPAELDELVPTLEWFFAPYNQLLADLIGADFQWSPSDHRLPAIDDAERDRRRAELDLIVQRRTARIKRQNEERAQRMRDSKEFRRLHRQKFR
eukprot:6985057-Prymnesium_polylepis.1